MRWRAWPVAVALALTACDDAGPGATAQVLDPMTIALTGQGNEPGWNVTVADGSVRLVTNYGEQTQTAPVTAATATGESRIVLAPPVTITQNFAPCSDDMSGRPFPYRVEVETGEQVLKGCGGSVADLFAAGNWRVSMIDNAALAEDSGPTVRFDGAGGLSGDTGCNSFAGHYEIIEGALRIGPLAVTRRACVDTGMGAREGRMLARLQGDIGFNQTADDGLVLIGPDGSLTLRRAG